MQEIGLENIKVFGETTVALYQKAVRSGIAADNDLKVPAMYKHRKPKRMRPANHRTVKMRSR